jgi:hypothetical protein
MIANSIHAAKTALAEGEMLLKHACDDLRPRKEPLPPLPPRATNIDERIAHVRECMRRHRWTAAGLALIELRLWHEASACADEWPDFIATRLAPIESADIAQLIGKVLYHGGLLQCAGCGVHAACQCGCGTPYVVEHPWAAPAPVPARKPTALDRAIAAILASPEKSDRAIAAEIGVGRQTVGRARQRMKAAGSDGTPDGTLAP